MGWVHRVVQSGAVIEWTINRAIDQCLCLVPSGLTKPYEASDLRDKLFHHNLWLGPLCNSGDHVLVHVELSTIKQNECKMVLCKTLFDADKVAVTRFFLEIYWSEQ